MPLILQVYLSIYKSTYIFTPLAIKIVFLSLHACFYYLFINEDSRKMFYKESDYLLAFQFIVPNMYYATFQSICYAISMEMVVSNAWCIHEVCFLSWDQVIKVI